MDPRVARTRASLEHALLEVIREEGFEAATVARIAEYADVNRTTFYQHYPDRETLLADALDRAVASVDPGTSWSVGDGGVPSGLRAYLEHVYANADIYRRILADGWSTVVLARLQVRLEIITSDSLSQVADNPYRSMPLEVASAGLSGAAIGVARAWLAMDPLPDVDTAARWMWEVLQGGTSEVQNP